MKVIAKVTISLLLVLVIGLTACGKEFITLEDKTWVLESYGEPGNLQSVVEDTEITIRFDSDTHRFSGSAGCNNYFGGYKLDVDNKLTIPGPIGATEKSCGEQIDRQEYEYLRILKAAETYMVNV